MSNTEQRHPALKLAELILSMDMATPKGLRARELARQTLLQADDMLTTLRLIEHATAPTREDGGHHENAFELSHACIERVTVHMPQPLASPTQPASAPIELIIEWIRNNYQDHSIDSLCEELRAQWFERRFDTPAAPAQSREEQK